MTSRVLLRLALVAASIAWMSWGYLHTIGDPTRGEEIAVAVLDDAEARHELASPIANQLRYIGDLPAETIDELTVAVSAALTDPDISGQIISAFAAAHAQTLGVDDERSTAIDMNSVSLAIHRRLDQTSPVLAARVPNDVDLKIELPVLAVPYAADFRSFAHAAVLWTAIGAATAASVAFVMGSRRRVLRRVGIWALVSGGLTIGATKLWVLGARTFIPPLDSTLTTGIETATASVVDAAWLLVMVGVPAIVVSMFLSRAPADLGASTTARPATEPSPGATRESPSAATTPPPNPTTTPSGASGSGFYEGYDVDERYRREAAVRREPTPTVPPELRWSVDSRGSVVRTVANDVQSTRR